MNKRKQLHIVFISLCMSLAMTMQYGMFEYTEKGSREGKRITELLWQSFRDDSLLGSILFIMALIGLFRYYEKIKIYKTTFLRAVSLFLAIMMAAGLSLNRTGSFLLLYNGKEQIIKTIILVYGYQALYSNGAALLWYIIKEKEVSCTELGNRFFAKDFFKRPFLLILAIWAPQVIIKYPGAMCYDSYNQLYQYFGIENFTSHHPPFHTYILGKFVQLEKYFGTMNMGLFLFVIVQALCFIATLSYTFSLLEKWKVRTLYRSILLLIYCFVPYYVGYAGVVIKDTAYGVSFLLYTLCLADFIHSGPESLQTKRGVSVFVLASTLVTLFRNNGIYVVAPTSLALILYSTVTYKKVGGIKRLGFLFSVPVMLYMIINTMLFSVFQIEKGSKREMLSIPFQQTACYVRHYDTEVTSTEKMAINRILEYDVLAEKYDPRISDPVKATYKEGATSAELRQYFKVWYQQLSKHPSIYVQATLHSIYGLFCPQVDNYVYYTSTKDSFGESTTFSFKSPKALEPLQQEIGTFYQFLHTIPVLSLFGNIACYVILFMYLIVFILKDKKYKYLLLMIPGALSILIAIASPVILGHPRYLFPIVYTVPVLFALYTVIATQRE